MRFFFVLIESHYTKKLSGYTVQFDHSIVDSTVACLTWQIAVHMCGLRGRITLATLRDFLWVFSL